LLKRVALFVVLPTALAGLYFGVVASSQYESVTSFTVQSSDVRPMMGMEGLLAGLSGGGRNDVLTVRDYVLSRDMLSRLDKEHGFIKHFKDQRQDWFSRLSADASFEDAYAFYAHHVYAEYDSTSGSITVKVRAFDPKTAQTLARSIVTYSEEMVNKLSDRERHDRTAYAESDVKRAETRLTEARKRLVALQQEHSDFSPMQTATSTMEIRSKIEAELARARAELMQKRAYMQDDAPQVLAAQTVVNSLSAQVSTENRRLVDPRKPEGLGTSLADFEAAMVEKEFSQKAYQGAMVNLEAARADADRQHRYLAVVATPSSPDRSTHPHRQRSILTAFILSFLLMGVGSLVSAAIREHARL
jgi:capsular polysaccharide transport system permease protein